MSKEEAQSWREFALVNRERIERLAVDLHELRDSVHRYRGEAQAVTFLGQQVRDMARQVEELGKQVQVASSRALRRPTPTTLSLLLQFAGWIVAVSALAFALTR